MVKNLDKKTLKWCAKQLQKAANDLGPFTKKRTSWNSTTIASPGECASRQYMLTEMAKRLRKGKTL